MSIFRSAACAFFLSAVALATGRAFAADAPPPVPAQEQPEVLTRGPVHEAFAEPVPLQNQAGLTAPQQPPPPITENPPAERPEGDQFVWVPGYWSWDSDRNGYVWVSACWRVAPPNSAWVPGYWAQANGGWQWVAGFWTTHGAQEIEYLPAPPAIDDTPPAAAAPTPDSVWVPPVHYWVEGRYVPRAGYWLPQQEGWVWAPSHYTSTPRGFVFCAGHWDYALDRRGVLFAPVYFPAAAYARQDFVYSPDVVVDLGILSANLFTRPTYSHYYFGDYYDDVYLNAGIYPRFEVERNHTWYDPIFVYDRWHNVRSEPKWEDRVRSDYELRRHDVALRPARTFREQEVRLAKTPEAQRGSFRVAERLNVAISSKRETFKFEQINEDSRRQIATQAAEVHKFRDQRSVWESPADKRGAKPEVAEPRRPEVRPEEIKRPEVRTAERNPQPAEPRRPEARPEERNTPPAEPRRTAEPPLAEPRRPVTPSVEPRRPEARPEERTPALAQPANPGHESQAGQSDRFKMPGQSPIGRVAGPGNGGRATPAQPADEGRHGGGGAAPAEVGRGRGK